MEPDKYHASRLKGIAKTLAEAEANKKTLVAMAAKVEKTLERLSENITKLDSKISKYKMLYDNVKRDPNFKMNTDDLKS